MLFRSDCIPSRQFVQRHKELAEQRYFLGANRVLLSPDATRSVLREQTPLSQWSWARWALAWARRDVNRVLPLLTLPDGRFRKWAPDRWEGIKTCNFSLWRSDLVGVNGLDESYEGWGLEDSDLVIRLLRRGVKHKSARYAAPVFHLWHREQARSGLEENRVRLNRVLHSQSTQAVLGLNRYSMGAG